MFNNEQHCVGWNAGRNPLPLVLVDDVAAAIVSAVGRRNIAGKCYNLVGDVRIDARGYIQALAKVTRRPLRFHPSLVIANYLGDLGKWLLKRAGGRRAPPPALRDLRSRGLVARFDCDDAARDLEWQPVADRDTFLRRAFTGL
jgi:nucleoside-diphosphate-sugar epimerase